MNSRGINLHIEKKKVLSLIVLSSLLSVILCLVVLITCNKKLIQLSSLKASNYDYSVTATNSVGHDEYLKFNAGISFSILQNSDECLNADIVMQPENANYTDMVFWNGQILSVSRVAVSEGLAHRNALAIGDTLFSKHCVDGTYHNYIVETILPDAIGVRSEKTSFSDGIIIMGFDELYFNNLSHKYIVFTNDDINSLIDIPGNSFERIVYREDEISACLVDLLPYLAVLIIASLVVTFAYASILTKQAAHNFKRLAVLGHDNKNLNAVFRKTVFGPGTLMIILSFTLASALCLVCGICKYGICMQGLNMLINMIALGTIVHVQRKLLWRK